MGQFYIMAWHPNLSSISRNVVKTTDVYMFFSFLMIHR